MKALLVIDMQKASFDQTDRWDASGVISRINQLSKSVRESGGVVIFIQHNGTEHDRHAEGAVGWEILDELDRVETDLVIHKSTCDSFYKTSLESTLRSLSVDHLIVTGCATDFCVDTTIRSALSHDFSVTVVSDGHTTADHTHMTAEQVRVHHQFVWEELLLNGTQTMSVRPCDELIEYGLYK